MSSCPTCGADVAAGLLACVGCGWLVNGTELTRLAQQAEEKERAEDIVGALTDWRTALMLLPAGTRQHAQVAKKLEVLSSRPIPRGAKRPKAVASGEKKPWWMAAGTAILAALWKLKALLVLAATKWQFLVLGLAKGGTLLSMFGFFAVLGTATGWKVALGIVLAIYVHEMGHVAELVRRGFPASPPMFVPGLGAFVRLHMRPASVIEDARIGMAGPLWGLGATLAAWGWWMLMPSHAILAVTKISAFINLLNLAPIWQLDGSRGFASLTRIQRALVAVGFGVALLVTHEPLLIGLLILAGARVFVTKPADEPDWTCLGQFILLTAALSWLNSLPLPKL